MSKRKNQEAWNAFRAAPIGTAVIVSSEMEDVGEDGQHNWVPKIVEEYYAWVTGTTWMCNGRVETIHYPAVARDGDVMEPSKETFLNVSYKVPVFLVRTSMFGREIKVPVGGVRDSDRIPHEDNYYSPVMKQNHPVLSERDKRIYSEEAKSMERDSRGRFARKKKK